jgi:molecular chaperone HtpG
MEVKQATLYGYLKAHSDLYYGKAIEVEQTVRGWLSYIPSSFPHYTRHTIEHSEEIILQASKLLFTDGDANSPVVNLSGLEAYIFIVSAYLHDSGMVVSDQEKLEILSSDSWTDWVSGDGGGEARYQEINRLRLSSSPADEAERNFLADVQTRYLLAEFVRRAHHVRAGTIIGQHQSSLGRFAFDDPILERTIAAICTAHGLPKHELDNQEQFPERRDIRGETINIRFLAILLRLSDLLDMSTDRACPLLLNAACPLPGDSLAHWTQYQRLIHRLTAPDKIAITADCETQEEHRVLQDWCQWIVDEVANARTLMVRSARHKDWAPPTATLDGAEPTIIIRPSPTASYIPSKWSFELDQHLIFERLIHDIYQHPLTFIRELIQNGLDANRCQMYSDLKLESVTPPTYPTELDEVRRNKYPLHLSLESRQAVNSLSGQAETRQVLVVEDHGIGMDQDIIRKYFLQVGRSYYTTEEFRRAFEFVPTSRFGLGFLSVFAVSERVTIDTYKPTSLNRDGPLRLTLTGARNYLLTERGHRSTPGTRIEVFLKEPIGAAALIQLVTDWCKRVEFPILITNADGHTYVNPERPESFFYDIPDVTRKKGRFILRYFPIGKPGIEGEIYVAAHVDERGESWADWGWTHYRYPKLHPQALPPPTVGSLVCVNGITVTNDRFPNGPLSIRVDYRARADHLDLSRERIRHQGLQGRRQDPKITERIEEIVRDHLRNNHADQKDGDWIYKQQLVKAIPLPSFWASFPETIRVDRNGKSYLLSLKELQAVPILKTVIDFAATFSIFEVAHPSRLLEHFVSKKYQHEESSKLRSKEPMLFEKNIELLSESHRDAIFSQRAIEKIVWNRRLRKLVIEWRHSTAGNSPFELLSDRPILTAQFGQAAIIGARIHKTTNSVYETLVLNRTNPLVEWILRATGISASGTQLMNNLSVVLNLLDPVLRYGGHELPNLLRYLEEWQKLEMPNDVPPPAMGLKQLKIMFTRNPLL